MTTGEMIVKLSEWIDSSSTDNEALNLWNRTAKLGEEVGEAFAAIYGYLGSNPRKGVTHSLRDVESELFDVVVTALGAIAHIRGNDTADWEDDDLMDDLGLHVAFVCRRAGLI